MSKRQALIEKYAGDLRDKCKVTPDMDLLTKVTSAAARRSMMPMQRPSPPVRSPSWRR